MECINHGTRWASFILILSIRQTTPTLNNQLYPTAVSVCTCRCTCHYCMFHQLQIPQLIHLHLQGKSFFLHTDFQAYSTLLDPCVNSFFLFQMAALNFECILVMLKDGGTIPRGTLRSQDGINLGDICFCLILHTPRMQRISLDGLCTLLSEGTFTPLQSHTPPELSRTMAILLVFQADSKHKRIINIYVGLVVCRVNSHLYSPSQINNFIQDIDVDLREVHNALKAGRNAGKRCAYCLFVDNLSGIMSIPMDPPYCLVYPTTYVKGAEPNHFNTRNNPMGTHLHRCVCQATLQFSNTDPKQHTKYAGSCPVIPCGVQYNDRLYSTILEPRNHHSPLIDPVTREPCLMEVVGNFKAVDPIFKGSYRDSFLYSEDDLAQLRQQKVYLSTFQEEIPVPPAPSYQQNSEPVAVKQSHTGWWLQTHLWSPPRLGIPAARAGLHGAWDAAPIPPPQSAPIPRLPRNPLILRNQPWTAWQSFHRPTAPRSMATHPLLPQSWMGANEGIFVG